MSNIFKFIYGIQQKKKKTNFRVVLGWAYRGLTGGFLLLQNFSVAISVSPHVYLNFNFDFYVSKIMHL